MSEPSLPGIASHRYGSSQETSPSALVPSLAHTSNSKRPASSPPAAAAPSCATGKQRASESPMPPATTPRRPARPASPKTRLSRRCGRCGLPAHCAQLHLDEPGDWGIVRAGLGAGGRGKSRSAARYFMLRGVLIGGALGVPLCIVIELGYLVLRYGGLNLGSGSMATFLLLLFVADFGFRGLVFGLIIGTLTAAVALLTRQRLRIATRSRRVLAVAAVSSFTSGALAWLAAYAALGLGDRGRVCLPNSRCHRRWPRVRGHGTLLPVLKPR